MEGSERRRHMWCERRPWKKEQEREREARGEQGREREEEEEEKEEEEEEEEKDEDSEGVLFREQPEPGKAPPGRKSLRRAHTAPA